MSYLVLYYWYSNSLGHIKCYEEFPTEQKANEFITKLSSTSLSFECINLIKIRGEDIVV